MISGRRIVWLMPACLAAVLSPLGHTPACAQLFDPSGNPTRFELAEDVGVDRADSAVVAQLERVKAYLADRQWDEAVDTLGQLLEGSEGKLLGVTPRRYVGLREYVHLQFASLPPEALTALPQSRRSGRHSSWYEQGIASGAIRQSAAAKFVRSRRLPAASVTTRLMALGEIGAGVGRSTPSARWYWERIVPADLPQGRRRAPGPAIPTRTSTWPTVRARLVLVSILEGSLGSGPRGAWRSSCPLARARPKGRLGGREVDYADALGALLDRIERRLAHTEVESRLAHLCRQRRGATSIAPPLVDVGASRMAWRLPLKTRRLPEGRNDRVELSPAGPDRRPRVGRRSKRRSWADPGLPTGRPAWGRVNRLDATQVGAAIYRARATEGSWCRRRRRRRRSAHRSSP